MNKVIFVCFLSISMCLCNPAAPLDVQNGTKPTEPAHPTQAKTETVNATSTNIPAAAVSETTNATAAVATTNAASAAATTNATQAQPATPVVPKEANQPKNSTVAPKPIPEENSTQNKETPAKSTEPKDKKEVTEAPATKPAEKKPDGKEEKKPETSTPKNDTVSPTAPTKADASEKVTLQSRAFDGPSFIGGIILTLGLLAIGFMGFKYYKNQTERNYHTL